MNFLKFVADCQKNLVRLRFVRTHLILTVNKDTIHSRVNCPTVRSVVVF